MLATKQTGRDEELVVVARMVDVVHASSQNRREQLCVSEHRLQHAESFINSDTRPVAERQISVLGIWDITVICPLAESYT